LPLVHLSPVEQAFPSLQASVLGAYWHPSDGWQESVVHGLSSEQTMGLDPTQTPPEQVSFVVHTLPSLQLAVFGLNTQPIEEEHESFVHGLESEHAIVWPAHTPLVHWSFCVHALPSLQDRVFGVCAHPPVGLHESSVHGFESLQLMALPGRHSPCWQVSPTVQTLPSLHGAVLKACTQPASGEHESLVHGSSSLQDRTPEPMHARSTQMSRSVQALPSSQGAVVGMFVQPSPGTQPSMVHWLPSSQLGPPEPAQVPDAQVSFVVQALPSSQDCVLFVWTQPVEGLHASFVQTLPSLQLAAPPGTQTPPLHVSCTVHALPSEQDDVFAACVHPVAGLHASVVQTFASLQFGAGPPTQLPLEHVSAVVQALPSEHGAELGV
jgi:hypothetical protein